MELFSVGDAWSNLNSLRSKKKVMCLNSSGKKETISQKSHVFRIEWLEKTI
jgi:hypothetical protein